MKNHDFQTYKTQMEQACEGMLKTENQQQSNR